MTREEQEQMILENVPKVYEAGRGSIKNEVANALKGSASGEVVALKDVSPLEHGLGVRVSSKNLADIYAFSAYGMISPSLTNSYGTTISTTEPSDSVEIVQSQTGNQTSVTSYTNGYFCIGFRNHFKDGDKITLSFDLEIKENPLNAKVWKLFMKGTSGGQDVSITSGRISMVIEWSNKDDGKPYVEIRNAGCSCVISNIQLEKGTTATAYTPFVPDVGAVKVKAQGVNIIDITEMLNNQLVDNGDGTYTITKNGDGGLRFANWANINIPKRTEVAVNIDFIEIGCEPIESVLTIQFMTDDENIDTTIGLTPENVPRSFYFSTKNLTKARFCLSSKNKDGEYVKFKNFQFEYGTAATEYEPYIEPVEYAVNADGTVEGVKSISPATTLTTDTVGALIEVDYNRDINKAFEELRKVILSLGGIL
jgi:hypothetical protein